MPAVALPMLPGEPSVCASVEGLDVFLAPVNDPLMQARIGQETVVQQDDRIVVAQGEKFRNRTGWAQGRRYLRLDAHAQAVAVLNVSLRKQGARVEAVASNVYTHPDHRRQGLAAELFARALADFPRLMADNALSEAGAALIGHTATPAPRRSRPGLG